MRADNIRRISVCQFSTFRWSFFEDVVRYAAHGFESMGIWRRKLEDFGTSAAIDLLYEMKMSVSSVHWTGGFTGDGQSFIDSIEDAIEAIHLTGRLNAGCLILHPGSRNGHTTKHAHRLLNSALTNLVPVAADCGIKLVLEPINSHVSSPWTFIEKFDDYLAVLDNFPSQHLGLVLDTFHVGLDSNVYQSLAQFVDRIELVQLADRSGNAHSDVGIFGSYRVPLGQGQIPIEAWLSKLQRLGYAGQYELEVHGQGVDGIDYRSLLKSTFDYFSSTSIERLIQIRPQSANPRHRFELDEKLRD